MGRDGSWVYGAVRFLDVDRFGGALAGRVSGFPNDERMTYVCAFVDVSGGELSDEGNGQNNGLMYERGIDRAVEKMK